MLIIKKSISKKTQKPYHCIYLDINGISIPLSYDKQTICRLLSIKEGRYIDYLELENYDMVQIL